MKETITTVTYSISGIPSVCLHFEGEIRKSELPVSLQREFGFTNHCGEVNEEVMAIQFFTIGKDITVEVDVDDVEVHAMIINDISDLYENHKRMYALEGLEFELKKTSKIVKVKRVKKH